MYRLAELSVRTRRMAGWGLLLLGSALLALGVIWIHFSSLPHTVVVDGVEVPLVVDYFNWWPRGVWWKGAGYLVVFAASQMMIGGAVFLWVLNQRITWSRAVFTAFLSWLELVIIFGMVPSEWLSFAQTDLDWSSQKIALVVPPILVLGNTVEISYAVIKDSISMGYHLVMLAVAAIFALQVQKITKGRPESAAEAREEITVRPPPGQGRDLMVRGVVDETPPIRDDYQLAVVDGDYFTDKLRPKQFLHIDQAECIICEGCVDICPWKCIHYLSLDAITEGVNVDHPADDPQNLGFFIVDEDECTRCALCVDRCPTNVISLGKFEGSLADQAVELGLDRRPWDFDTGQRDFKNGYAYGMRW